MDSLTMIATSRQSAILFAILLGLSLGTVVSIMEISTALIRRKIEITETSVLKYFAVLIGVSALVGLLYCAAITLFSQPSATRVANFSHNLDALSYPLFLAVTGLSMLSLSIPAQRLSNRIISRSGIEDRA